MVHFPSQRLNIQRAATQDRPGLTVDGLRHRRSQVTKDDAPALRDERFRLLALLEFLRSQNCFFIPKRRPMRYTRVVIPHYGGPEVIATIEEDIPTPEVGDVRVKVFAAGVSLPGCPGARGRSS